MRRISVNGADPDYCPWMHAGDSLGDIKVYLKDAPDAKIYFETVDQDNREAVIFVFDTEGQRVIVEDDILRATIKNVDVVIEMTDERRLKIEAYFDGENMKQLILDTIEDMIGDFLYYDRKEDEDLPLDAIQAAIKDGEITEEEIVAEFTVQLKKGLN